MATSLWQGELLFALTVQKMKCLEIQEVNSDGKLFKDYNIAVGTSCLEDYYCSCQ